MRSEEFCPSFSRGDTSLIYKGSDGTPRVRRYGRCYRHSDPSTSSSNSTSEDEEEHKDKDSCGSDSCDSSTQWAKFEFGGLSEEAARNR